MPGDVIEEKLDELVSETKRTRRIALWQLLFLIMSAIPSLVAALIRLPLEILTVAAILPIVVGLILVGIDLSSYSNSSWYDRISDRERLRIQSKLVAMNTGYSGYEDLYESVLRMHYQYALVEGRQKLADYLKSELDKNFPDRPESTNAGPDSSEGNPKEQ